MSKTFKSASSERKVRIWEANLGVAVCVEDPITNETTSTQIAPSDAPALALAILEAAGVEPDREPLECQVSLGTIVADLQETIQYAEALASAHREQAELEAEALGLLNAYLHSADTRLYATWEEVVEVSKRMAEDWLAVARKAREIGA